MAPYSHHHDGGQLQQTPSSMYPLLGPNPMALLNSLFILLTIGQASLLFLLGTLLFSKRIPRRNATMLNLVLVTIASTIPPPILYYGKQILNRQPPFHLCFAQAILKHGSDPMFVIAAFALVLEILLQTGTILWPFAEKLSIRLLVASPYIIFALFATWALALGDTHRHAVQHVPNDYYCSVAFSSFGWGIDIFSMAIILLSIALEVYAIIKSRRMWKDVRHVQPSKVYSNGLYLRVLAFTLCQMSLFMHALFVFDFYFKSVATHVIPIVYESAMPLITFLIFASAPDILAAWKFWGKRNQDAERVEGARASLAVPEASLTITTITNEPQSPFIPATTTTTRPSSIIRLNVEIPDSSLGPIPYLSDP